MRTTTSLVAALLLATAGAVLGQEPAPAAAPPASPAAAPAAAQAPAAPPVVTPPRVFYEAAVITVSGKAEYAGNIQLEIEPVGGTAKTVSVNVLAKDKAKAIASQLQRELSIAAGSDYKVKLSGERVKIKKASSKKPNISVTIRQVALAGVSVLVEKD